MPGDLRDPEQLFPFHYDSRYSETPNPTLFDSDDISVYLQAISEQEIGKRLNPEKLSALKRHLESKGLFHRNPGDEPFRCEVQKFVQRLAMARKVVQKCLI